MQNDIVASEEMSIQLKGDSGEDFVLTGRTAWLDIEGYTLHINNHDDRLSVYLYKINHEAEDELEGFSYKK
tara:strand:- start:200 stop:412 length:213 start_codon:yes stop_codon:yes gene_type:complete